MAQDDYYYEIQLTNKQMVFYFMAGATGLILSFLAGIMVGRGVDAAAGEVQASRPPQEERIVEETPAPSPATPPAEELTYAKRLEGDRVEEGLERPRPAGAPAATSRPPATPPAASRSAAAPPAASRSAGAPPAASRPAATPPAASGPAATPPARAVAATSAPAPSTRPASAPPPVGRPVAAAAGPAPAKAVAPGPGTFTIQVGAFKDGASAEAVVGRLRQKGFAAYVVPPPAPDGLFNVRVGAYRGRTDAERVQARLRDTEKFKPFIVAQ